MLLTEVVRFRLSKEERKEMNKMAKERDVSISDLMRERIFGNDGETNGRSEQQND